MASWSTPMVPIRGTVYPTARGAGGPVRAAVKKLGPVVVAVAVAVVLAMAVAVVVVVV